MVDYIKETGANGEMRIRDTGTVVEFWLRSTTPGTFAHELPWGYTVNGVTNNNREYDYKAGSGWEKFGSWTVSTDQTVTFRIFDTGTAGFGGPTSFSVEIERATVPAAPSTPVISNVASTTMNVAFNDGANGGSPITNRQIGYGTLSTPPQHIVNSDGSTTLTGLTPGTLYYVWARTQNAKGFSPWSTRVSKTTLRVPDPPNAVVISDITQVSMIMSFTANGDGGAPILERQIGYGTSPTAPQASFTYTGVHTLTGLDPAKTYYFWTRVRNSAGWSPYSAVKAARTVAGAWVKVGAEFKEAIPYVKVDGVWELAQPWQKSAGVWRPTL